MPDAESGEVRRETVLQVLRFHKVEISADQENPDAFLLVKGEIVDSKAIPEWVGRRLLQHLKRKFDIPIHHFYHPDIMQFDSIESGPHDIH